MSPEKRPRVLFNVGKRDLLMLIQAQIMITIGGEAGGSSTTLFRPGDQSFAYQTANLSACFKWSPKGDCNEYLASLWAQILPSQFDKSKKNMIIFCNYPLLQ